MASGRRSLPGSPERAQTAAFLRGHSGGWPRAMVAEVTLPPQEDAGWWGGVLDTSWLNRLVVVSLHSRTACVHTAHPMTATDACYGEAETVHEVLTLSRCSRQDFRGFRGTRRREGGSGRGWRGWRAGRTRGHRGQAAGRGLTEARPRLAGTCPCSLGRLRGSPSGLRPQTRPPQVCPCRPARVTQTRLGRAHLLSSRASGEEQGSPLTCPAWPRRPALG